MTVASRPLDELHGAPALATLPALSACIDAFDSALHVVHPDLVSRDPRSERESAALLLHMHLHTCQELLRLYDHLSFDVYCFSDSKGDEPDEDPDDPDDDIPF